MQTFCIFGIFCRCEPGTGNRYYLRLFRKSPLLGRSGDQIFRSDPYVYLDPDHDGHSIFFIWRSVSWQALFMTFGEKVRSLRKEKKMSQDQTSTICIDLKSFYASVECVERGLNPFKTNLVVADPTRSK